jgi:uncharacterized protein (DUF305 family)
VEMSDEMYNRVTASLLSAKHNQTESEQIIAAYERIEKAQTESIDLLKRIVEAQTGTIETLQKTAATTDEILALKDQIIATQTSTIAKLREFVDQFTEKQHVVVD